MKVMASTRRRFATLLLTGLVASAAGCATAGTVEVERKQGYDLAAAKTYAWVTEDLILIQFGKDHPKVRTKENEKRVRARIDRAFEAEGLTKVDKAEADLLIAFSVGVRIRYRVEGGDSTSLLTESPSEKRTKGTLNIYAIDRATEEEVWHGATSKWLDASEDPDVVVDKAVTTIMTAFPGN